MNTIIPDNDAIINMLADCIRAKIAPENSPVWKNARAIREETLNQVIAWIRANMDQGLISTKHGYRSFDCWIKDLRDAIEI